MVPELTGDLPATLCADAIALVPDAENTLIVTDSLAMGAITDSYTPGEAAVQALQAGCDVLLMPDGLADAYDAVLAAVQNGTDVYKRQTHGTATPPCGKSTVSPGRSPRPTGRHL